MAIDQPRSKKTTRKNVDQVKKSMIEYIYSSVPPDVKVESVTRHSRSRLTGRPVEVSRNPDTSLLKIRLVGATPAEDLESTCCICSRQIPFDELSVSFPSDLDRRRIWGTMLGFRNMDSLRFRSVNPPQWTLCTDHFSEECLRKFNFNRAAIEALGVPIARRQRKLNIKPWSCSVCAFRSYSVYETRQHIVDFHGGRKRQTPQKQAALLRRARELSVEAAEAAAAVMLLSSGHQHMRQASPISQSAELICPFCRRCNYSYRTISGLVRHLETGGPLAHSQLRKIHEEARTQCRAQYLEDADNWETWSAHNVSMAFFGQPPPEADDVVSTKKSTEKAESSARNGNSGGGLPVTEIKTEPLDGLEAEEAAALSQNSRNVEKIEPNDEEEEEREVRMPEEEEEVEEEIRFDGYEEDETAGDEKAVAEMLQLVTPPKVDIAVSPRKRTAATMALFQDEPPLPKLPKLPSAMPAKVVPNSVLESPSSSAALQTRHHLVLPSGRRQQQITILPFSHSPTILQDLVAERRRKFLDSCAQLDKSDPVGEQPFAVPTIGRAQKNGESKSAPTSPLKIGILRRVIRR